MYNDDGEQIFDTGISKSLGFLAYMPALDGTATPLLEKELCGSGWVPFNPSNLLLQPSVLGAKMQPSEPHLHQRRTRPGMNDHG